MVGNLEVSRLTTKMPGAVWIMAPLLEKVEPSGRVTWKKPSPWMPRSRSRPVSSVVPWVKTLDQFDFAFQPSIDEKRIKDLATLRFVEQADVLLFTGPPGVGKTHLAIGLGMEAIRAGYSVYFLTLSELADQVPRERTDPKWVERLRVLSYPKLLIVDEVGYVPLDPVVSYFVFSLVCRRYEKGAMIWTSNKSFGDWASVFARDEVLTAAILDRLLHHGTVVNIRGRSHRLRDKLQAGTAYVGAVGANISP